MNEIFITITYRSWLSTAIEMMGPAVKAFCYSNLGLGVISKSYLYVLKMRRVDSAHLVINMKAYSIFALSGFNAKVGFIVKP